MLPETTTPDSSTNGSPSVNGHPTPTVAPPLADPTVDSRVAATGGRRERWGDPKSPYIWPGMMRDADWRRTNVHKHSSYYCARCAKPFRSPAAVYTHLAKVHPPTGLAPRNRPLRPAEGSANGAGRVARKTGQVTA
jgi:hypothetical protein